MSEKFPTEKALPRFRVKLYHPRDELTPCSNQGKSEFVVVTATGKPNLRTKTESGAYDIFKGDTCKLCSALAKVSIEELG